MATNKSNRCVFARGKKKMTRETLPWLAAQIEAEVMNQPLKPRRPRCERAGYRNLEPLNEDPITATDDNATEPARTDLDPNQLPRGGRSESSRWNRQ